MISKSTKVSAFSNRIYPCSDMACDYIGPLDAWSNGDCYLPCHKCGADKEQRVGRFTYEKQRMFKSIPFISKWVFKSVEWRRGDA